MTNSMYEYHPTYNAQFWRLVNISTMSLSSEKYFSVVHYLILSLSLSLYLTLSLSLSLSLSL
jgi:hypothetical protein